MYAARTGSHLFDGHLVDDVVVVLIQVAVQRHAVALEQQILKRVQSRDAERPLNAVRQVRIVEADVEAEHFGALCDGLAHVTCRRTPNTNQPLCS